LTAQVVHTKFNSNLALIHSLFIC